MVAFVRKFFAIALAFNNVFLEFYVNERRLQKGLCVFAQTLKARGRCKDRKKVETASDIFPKVCVQVAISMMKPESTD